MMNPTANIESATAINAGFKQTEVGWIPVDWEVVQLGEIGNFKNGINKGKEDFGYGHPFVNLLDVFGKIEVDTSIDLGKVNSSDAERELYSLKEGDVIFVRSSVKPSGVGLTILCNEDLPNSVFSGFLIRYRDNGRIAKAFKRHCFHEAKFRHRLIAKSTVSANTNINQEALKALQIPLPPTLAEQTAIATALSDMDALIQVQEELLAKKRALKQGAMQELLRPKEGWVVKRLGEVLEKVVGGGTPSRSVDKYWKGNIPWVTVKDFSSFSPVTTEEYITEEGLKNSSSNLIPSRTLITATRMSLGKANIYQVDVAINQDMKALFVKKDYDSLFIYYWFQLKETSIQHMGTGSTVLGISLNQLKGLELSYPPKQDQTHIACILSDMDTEIEQLEAQLSKYRQLKVGMMQELLTGKKRLI